MADLLAVTTVRLPADLMRRFDRAAEVMTEKGTGPKATRSDAIRRGAELGIVLLERALGIVGDEPAKPAPARKGGKPARKSK